MAFVVSHLFCIFFFSILRKLLWKKKKERKGKEKERKRKGKEEKEKPSGTKNIEAIPRPANRTQTERASEFNEGEEEVEEEEEEDVSFEEERGRRAEDKRERRPKRVKSVAIGSGVSPSMYNLRDSVERERE